MPLLPEPTSDGDIIDLTKEEGGVSSEDDTRMPGGPVDVQQMDHRGRARVVFPRPTFTSCSPLLGAALEEVNRLHPSQDTDNAEGVDAFDLAEEPMVLLSP